MTLEQFIQENPTLQGEELLKAFKFLTEEVNKELQEFAEKIGDGIYFKDKYDDSLVMKFTNPRVQGGKLCCDELDYSYIIEEDDVSIYCNQFSNVHVDITYVKRRWIQITEKEFNKYVETFKEVGKILEGLK